MDEGECPATLMDQSLDLTKDNKYEVTIINLGMDRKKIFILQQDTGRSIYKDQEVEHDGWCLINTQDYNPLNLKFGKA